MSNPSDEPLVTPRGLALSQKLFTGKSVVYVMSRDQRTRDNHALLDAQALAEKQNASLSVLFVLKKVPTRSREHYEFMLDGLREVSEGLSAHNIPFTMRTGDPTETIIAFGEEVKAGALFFDFSPLAGARSLAEDVAQKFQGSVTVVDTHNIIPAWAVSDKKEFAAHTMRTKVHRQLLPFLIAPAVLRNQSRAVTPPPSLSFAEAAAYIQPIPACGISVRCTAGEQAAQTRLNEFIEDSLENYAQNRNDIAEDHQTGLSPYLHFGQISSLRVALDVMGAADHIPLLVERPKLAEHSEQPSRLDGMNALLEELIVRKELADNFCFYTENYLTLQAAPEWARRSLEAHADDDRDFIYGLEQWESASTHDVVWNAAQNELTRSGKMHGYMRMYWAKKILEWSQGPEDALQTAVYLNDKYSIDGGDPNGYAGILWSIAGLHDRAWFERPVFGKIRYMNEAGLRRKFNVDEYIKRVNSL